MKSVRCSGFVFKKIHRVEQKVKIPIGTPPQNTHIDTYTKTLQKEKNKKNKMQSRRNTYVIAKQKIRNEFW